MESKSQQRHPVIQGAGGEGRKTQKHRNQEERPRRPEQKTEDRPCQHGGIEPQRATADDGGVEQTAQRPDNKQHEKTMNKAGFCEQ